MSSPSVNKQLLPWHIVQCGANEDLCFVRRNKNRVGAPLHH